MSTAEETRTELEPPAAEATEPESPDVDEDEDELEPPATDTDEPEAAAVPPMTERELEQAAGKLERERDRHAARVGEIMGEDANELVPCELCLPMIPGFRFPVEPDDDTKAAVLEAIGMGGTAELASADDARLCDTCNGLGVVLTGSHVPAHVTKPCRACRGAGYVEVGGPAPATPPGPADTRPPDVQAQEEAPPDVDPWGRHRGDPDYGRLPNYVT